MLRESEKDYPARVEISEETLDENTSLAKMLSLAGARKRVLDVGCASGYLARLMSARGCDVTGVDLNPRAADEARRWCSRVLVADLDRTPLHELFPEEQFDVVVLGDVLEHLREPWRVLDDARALLGYRGHAVASIPNIAHGAIRLALLSGRFDYSELGILDNTHLRFFTRRTIEELFVQCGYEIERVEKTMLPLFAPSDLVPSVNEADFDPAIVARVRGDDDCETLQFVLRARALDDAEKVAQLTRRFVAVSSAAAEAAEARDRAEAQLHETRGILQRTHDELVHTKEAFQNARSEADQAQRIVQHQNTLLDQYAALDQNTIRVEKTRFALFVDAESRLREVQEALAAVDRHERESRAIEALRQDADAARRRAQDAEAAQTAMRRRLFALQARESGLRERFDALHAALERLERERADLFDAHARVSAWADEQCARLDASELRAHERAVEAQRRDAEASERARRLIEQLRVADEAIEAAAANLALREAQLRALGEAALARTERETSALASLVAMTQSSRFWRLKLAVRRLFRGV